ncbi:CS1-pili formation C-terminal domain-containing protein [Psychromonas sp. Urea-02u-13]|uniref:CS1-pili formation C-terminal domain-containing protein n=1 Tax=Psychromonas sp. Urea-02u-13 TaxID=2058326 RepID=UPI000C32F248|nr:CS1-pili formation C-terminal domain-containing protein [Psychromonas sp. Urea-02u-13]PKG40497.1 pilus assembly protein PapC [Psychromonas sp. Urea-02u-13]
MKIKCLIIASLLFNISLSIASIQSEGIIIPDEFASLYEGSQEQFTFEMASAPEMLTISVMSTPTSATLNATSINKVENYLLQNNIKKQQVSAIINAMQNNMTNDSACHGKVAECSMIPETFAFSFDYELKHITFFANNKLLDKNKTSHVFHDSDNNLYGFINNMDFNYHYFSDSGSSLILRDKSLLGLKYGNMRSSLYLDSASNDLDVEQLSYDYEFQNRRLQVGHFKYGYEQNSTSFLDLTGSYSQEVVSYASSNNLISGGKQNSRSLYYLLPNQGRIEVYREGNLIYSKNVDSGQQSLSFRELPYGSYMATIVVISGGRELLTERQQIFNNNAFSLNQGEYDFSFAAGLLNDRYEKENKRNNDSSASFDINKPRYDLWLDNNSFAEAKGTYQLFDSALIGARLLSNVDNTMAEIGIKKSFATQISSDVKYALFDNGSQFLSADTNIYNVGVGYEQYRSADSEYSLDNYMLSNIGYRRLSVNVSANIYSGQGYLLLVNNNIDLANSQHQYVDQSDYWSVSAGYSHAFIANSTLNFSATYQNEEYRWSKNDWYAGILWSVPLSTDWSANSSMSLGHQGVEEFRNSLTNSQQVTDNLSVNTEVGVTYTGSDAERYASTDISSSANYQHRAFTADSYAYLSSDGTKSLNANLSTTQVISNTGKVYITAQKSDAYVVVDANNQQEDDSHRGLLSVYHEQELGYNENINQEDTVIAIDKYQDFNVFLDTESSNYISDDEHQTSGYALPGTVISLDMDLVKIKTFISSFDDLNNNAISEVKCAGEGCVDIEKIEQGVFKVSVIAGSDYGLYSQQQICVTPSLDRNSSTISNLGNNYCLPGLQQGGAWSLANNDNPAIQLNGKKYYFLGSFDNAADENTDGDADYPQTVKKLTAAGIETLSREVGNRQYLYVSNTEMLTAQQQTLLNELSLYALSTIEKNNFTQNWD